MTHPVLPLLRRAAACLNRALCTLSMRIAVVVAIVVAVSSSAHAAVPFEVKVTGTGPDVLAQQIAAMSDMVGEYLRPRLAAIKAPTRVMGS